MSNIKAKTIASMPEPKHKHMRWCTTRSAYQVRTDAGNLACKFYDCKTLVEARKIARTQSRDCGWAEIFRWAESGTTLRKYFIAEYAKEVAA